MPIKQRIEQFIKREGRRPRILVSTLGRKSHDQDYRLLASLFAETGFDVDISPLHQTPGAAARMAVENDVHIICFLTSGTDHRKLVTQLVTVLKAEKSENIRIVMGGAIPRSDYDFLTDAGVDHILHSVQIDAVAVNRILDLFE